MLKWLGKYDILSKNDESDLERKAALYQFHKFLSKSQSEELAYQDYKKCMLAKAAAFHTDGMSFAKVRGDKEAEQRHYMLYALHCNELGINPRGHVPPEINAFRGQSEALKKFETNPADLFVQTKS
jgi:hypothetical protein